MVEGLVRFGNPLAIMRILAAPGAVELEMLTIGVGASNSNRPIPSKATLLSEPVQAAGPEEAPIDPGSTLFQG